MYLRMHCLPYIWYKDCNLKFYSAQSQYQFYLGMSQVRQI